MTHLPPFRTRQSAAPPEPDDDFDDELPLLGEDAILERGAPEPAPADNPPWDIDDEDEVKPAGRAHPEPEDEAVTELLRDLNDVVPAATLAGAWSAQYESSQRGKGGYEAEGAPPVLTDVLMEAPLAPLPEMPASSPRASIAPEAAATPQPAEAPLLLARADADEGLEAAGLTAADEALAERIADSVLAALQPTLRDTVLDAVRDTLAAARRQP
ncbi:hypothetical protein IMZ29_09325 [Achromobacter sp. GG226]|uniref:hypothetical protein n=1 Tax=Verticiella alkaliphila TaxID=2779529 RepID=UPI001C0CBEB9|nr:hypothetical protein [Verticiella sp. GG226]MBU4610726.1 hypothetical protein [Verticiella sp. GG226]